MIMSSPQETSLSDRELKAFTDVISAYFETALREKPQIDKPYLKGDQQLILDFTGIIGFSGDRKGCIYLTSPKITLERILKEMGETDFSVDILTDMIGEVTNTISGNVRNVFGSNFQISVPISLGGRPSYIKLPDYISTLVIPINLGGQISYFIIGVEK